jgi:predicted DCC family thiol-disulfide oxidoreductase YuxK
MSEPSTAPIPVLVYDGGCGFCRIWIDYWRRLTGNRIEYIASRDVGDRFPQIPPEAYGQSVQLVRTDGTVASGARAVFESLGLVSLYHWVSGPSEIAYRFIAKHRNFAYQATRFTFGTRIEPTRFDAVQWIFVRLLALVYAVAFASLATQVEGLLGSRGILPVRELLASMQRVGPIRFVGIPSIFWLSSDDTPLTGIAWCGMVMAVMLFVTGFKKGRFERFILTVLFVLYLSYSAIGQDFLSFQWDSLLLEAGFLAIFLGRNRVIPWMFRWLAFRLFFLSGAVKLLSGDPTWRNLTALSFHFHTQPLPTVLAWYMDQLPAAVLRTSTWMVLAIELVVPFLIFFPRRIRLAGVAWMIALQVLIFLTGNYTFFNVLSVGLLLFVLDDQALRRVVPPEIAARFGRIAGRTEQRISSVVAAFILFLGLAHLWVTFNGTAPEPVRVALRYTGPFEIVNSYGLFAVMTTQRMEIIVEGSPDGNHWQPYEFRYKPGDVNTAPQWVEPFQPRLDWQMWFAALGNYRSNPWFVNFLVRLLEGSPSVEKLLAINPFPGQPPRFIRASVYEYTFTDAETRHRTGAWWKRQPKGLYLPPVGLKTTGGSETPSRE